MGIDPFGGSGTGGFFDTFGAFGTLFSVFLAIFAVMFVVVIGAFVYHGIGYARSPLMSAPARVVGKRADVSHHSDASISSTSMNSRTTTRYFVTFELADGQRLELHTDGRQYGQLAEGDSGILNWRDVVLRGFQRDLRRPDPAPRQVGGPLV